VAIVSPSNSWENVEGSRYLVDRTPWLMAGHNSSLVVNYEIAASEAHLHMASELMHFHQFLDPI
jgi:hypothetical protein